MSTLNELAWQAYSTNSGTTGSLNEVTYNYLSQVTGLSGITLNEQWLEALAANGYPDGSLSERQTAYWTALGYEGNWNELYYQWLTDGGAFGPNVTISSDDAPVFCGYQPPTTTDCTAAGDYTANSTGFTNPPDTWLWTIEPPVIGVDLTNATLQTCTVTTPTSDTDLTFNLKVVATDSVSTDTAERITTFIQEHNDTNVAPVYIGPNIAQQFVVQGAAINPIETFGLFTGTNLFFSLEGTWPQLLVIDSGTGQITGTATDPVADYTGLTVRATNSKGFAETDPFTVTVTAGAIAPVFDAGPVPAQVWQVGVPITQFPMSQYFSGSLPITYTIQSGALPAGLTMNSAGQINGTPTTDTPLTGSLVVRATNGAGFDDTNDWGWTSWEAIVQSVTIPDQNFILDTPYSQDMNDFFTGTITAWGMSGGWPAGFAINPSTGIVTGTATVTALSPNLTVNADNIYQSPVVSNNFDGISGVPISGTSIAETQAGACTYNPITLTAVELGTPTPTTVANYYTSTEGLIDQDYTQMTLVWSFYGVAYNNLATGYPLLSCANDQFAMGYTAVTGPNEGWDISLRRTNFSTATVRATGNPLAINSWHACMFAINAAGHAELWVDGVMVHTEEEGASTFAAMNTNGNMNMAKNLSSSLGLSSYLTHLWCHNVYYDPATYWSAFFDAANVPNDLGVDGSTPTGVQPLSCFPNGDATDNIGTLANWTEVGTVPLAPSSPTD